jgi:hypothetical protein
VSPWYWPFLLLLKRKPQKQEAEMYFVLAVEFVTSDPRLAASYEGLGSRLTHESDLQALWSWLSSALVA